MTYIFDISVKFEISLGFKDIGIRKFEFVERTQFLKNDEKLDFIVITPGSMQKSHKSDVKKITTNFYFLIFSSSFRCLW